MKYSIIYIVLFSCIHLHAQSYFAIKAELNYPLSNSGNELFRQVGTEIGLNYIIPVTSKTNFETGLNIDLYGRYKFVYQKTIASLVFQPGNPIAPRIETYQVSLLRMDLEVPLILDVNFKKITILTGLNLCYGHMGNGGNDPEYGQQSSAGSDLASYTCFYPGIYLGLRKQISNRFYVLADFKTPFFFYSNYYRIMGFGIIYSFQKPKKEVEELFL